MTVDLETREYPEHPGLGRKIAVLDPRSRQFPVSTLLSTGEDLVSKTWRRSFRALDQGETSECTIYSGKGMVNTTPFRSVIPSADRLNLETTPLYRWAQQNDEWPGENYGGTSCLAAAKSFHHHGLIDGYRWCFGLNDVLRTLSSYGPVTIGVTWYNSMFYPGTDGMLSVVESSGMAGGHAVQVIGINVAKEHVIIANSWGESWGNRGRCLLRFEDLGTLLADWGEAYTYVVN